MIWTQSLTLYNNKYMRDRWDFYFCLHIFYSLVIRLSRVCCWPLNFQSTGKILYQYVHKCSCNELFRRNVHFLSRKLFKHIEKYFKFKYSLVNLVHKNLHNFTWNATFDRLYFLFWFLLNNFLSLFFTLFFVTIMIYLLFIIILVNTAH